MLLIISALKVRVFWSGLTALTTIRAKPNISKTFKFQILNVFGTNKRADANQRKPFGKKLTQLVKLSLPTTGFSQNEYCRHQENATGKVQCFLN